MLHKKLIHREFGRRQKIAILSHLVTFEIDEKLCLAFHSKKNPFFLSFILCEWFLLLSSSFISPQTKFSMMLAIIHALIFVCTRIRRKRMNMQKKSAQNLPEIKAKEKMRTFNLKTLQY